MLINDSQIAPHNSDKISKLVEAISDIINSNQQGSHENIYFHQMNNLNKIQSSGFIAAKKIYHIRRMRDNFFKSELFSEPAWDILLDMYIADAEMRQSTVKSVSLASCVAMTTALRWIQTLEDNNLIASKKCPHDKRVRILTLTVNGMSALNKMFSEIKI